MALQKEKKEFWTRVKELAKKNINRSLMISSLSLPNC